MSFRTLTLHEADSDSRWDPEFYGKEFAAIRSALHACNAVPLRSFVREANRGVGPAYDPSGSVRAINSINIRDLEISEDRESRVHETEILRNPQAVANPGDLMVTSTGIGTLGRVFCNLSTESYLADGHVTILRLRNPNDAPYLCAFLQSSLGRIQFIQRRRGSSRQVEIYPDDVLSVLVPDLPRLRNSATSQWLRSVEDVAAARALYPAAEQAILDDFGWRAVTDGIFGNHFLSSLRTTMDQIRFDAEFFAPRNLLIEQKLKSSGAILFRDLEDSYVKGIQPDSYSTTGEVTVIKSKDVVKIGVNIDGCDRAHKWEIEQNSGIVKAGMLLLNMTGVGTLGRAAVAPGHSNDAVISVDVSGWRIRKNTLPAEYISLFLNSPLGTEQTLRYQTGSSGQLHIYPDHVRRLWIYTKRDAKGRVEDDWHAELADYVRRSSEMRIKANKRLKSLQLGFTDAVGIQPSILRE